MANTVESKEFYEYATVDTAPGSEGFFTLPVSPRYRKTDRLWLSVREALNNPASPSDVEVVVQFRCVGDAGWQTFLSPTGDAFIVGDRYILSDFGPGVEWRAGILDGGYVSGSVRFGFDW